MTKEQPEDNVDDFLKELHNILGNDTIKFRNATDDLNDSITIILKSHLFVENKIDELLEFIFPKGQILSKKFYFKDKLLILKSTNLIDNQTLDAIRKLNNVRNDIAHNLEFEITENIIDKIGNPLGKDYREMKQETFQEFDESKGYQDIIYSVPKIIAVFYYIVAHIVVKLNKVIKSDKGYFE
jgi:uncharacterized protein YutE (UPF0331/DUF86 family)